MLSAAFTAIPRPRVQRVPKPHRLWRSGLGAALASVIALATPPPAHADTAGTACVESGDTLYLDGHRAHGRCHGGEPVVLYGIDAPEIEQICSHKGQPWPCGRRSASALLQMTLRHTVVCQGNSRDRQNRLIAICHADGVELNRAMVEIGLAVSAGTRYARQEGEARAAHRGMWMGTFDRPADWRASR